MHLHYISYLELIQNVLFLICIKPSLLAYPGRVTLLLVWSNQNFKLLSLVKLSNFLKYKNRDAQHSFNT